MAIKGKLCAPTTTGLLTRLGGDEGLPGPAEVLLSEAKEGVRNSGPGYQVLDSSEEVEGQPKGDAPREIRVAGVHEIPPVGLHLAGELMLIGAERRAEIEQELELGGMLGRGRVAVHVIGRLHDRSIADRRRRIRIVEFIAEDGHEKREIYVGIGSVAGKDQVGEDLREGLIGTGRIAGQERIREIGKWILVR